MYNIHRSINRYSVSKTVHLDQLPSEVADPKIVHCWEDVEPPKPQKYTQNCLKFRGLWCVFELAAFRKANPGGHLDQLTAGWTSLLLLLSFSTNWSRRSYMVILHINLDIGIHWPAAPGQGLFWLVRTKISLRWVGLFLCNLWCWCWFASVTCTYPDCQWAREWHFILIGGYVSLLTSDSSEAVDWALIAYNHSINPRRDQRDTEGRLP